MPKLTKASGERLANLLFTTTSREVAPKVPKMKKFLYDIENDSGPLPSSILDGLLLNLWKQRPINEAPNDLPTNKRHVASNILQFPCTSAYIKPQDFKSLFPVHRERQYEIPKDQDLKFQVVKLRNPTNLCFENAYYLIFRNYIEACVYLNETNHKQVNGLGLNLKFVEMDHNRLKHIFSPYIEGKSIPQTGKLFEHVPIRELFCNSKKLKQIEQLSENPTNVDYDTMTKYIDATTRRSSIVVRNLPMKLTDDALSRILWDYELNKNPFITVIHDTVKQAHVKVIRFTHESCADRFVRNFHGKRWDFSGDGKLYEKVLCEVLD